MACQCENLKRLEKKFGKHPITNKPVYLDYAASTIPDLRTVAEFERICRTIIGNPSSFHYAGLLSAQELETSRETVASYLGWKPGEIYFCSGGTEALNTAIFGLRTKKSKFITTAIEHASIMKPVEYLAKKGFLTSIIPVDADGRINIEVLQNELDSSRENIFIYSPVNHETGSIQLIKEIFDAVKKVNGIVIIDAVQTMSKLLPNYWACYADCIALSSHKVYAPKGSGALCIKKNIHIRPMRFGGNQENGLFPGTPNLPGIAAFAKSITILRDDFINDTAHLNGLTQDLKNLLKKLDVPVIINSPETSVPGILNFSLPSIDNIEKLIIFLTQKNISISRFSACSKTINIPSLILTKMGIDKERAMKSLRISLGKFSTRDDLFKLLHAINDYCKKNNF